MTRGSFFWEDFVPILLEEEMIILDSSYYAPGGILNTYIHTQDVCESSLQEIFCSGSICLNNPKLVCIAHPDLGLPGG